MSAPSSVSATPDASAAAGTARPGRRPWTALAGIGYVVLSVAGLALAPLPDLGSGPAAFQHFRDAAHAPAYVAGGCAVLLAYLALVAFAIGVTAPGRRSGRGPGGAVLAVAGAVLAIGVMAMAAALVGSVVLTPALKTETAQALVSAGSMATWLSVLGVATMLAGIAALGSPGTGLPRWAEWVAGGLAVAVAAAVPAAESQLAHVPALLFDVWVLVVAVLVMRPRSV